MQSYYKEIKFWVYKGRKTRAPKNSWKKKIAHSSISGTGSWEKKNFNFFPFRNRLTANISFTSRCRWRSTTDFRFRTPEATTEGETTVFLPLFLFCSLLLQVIPQFFLLLFYFPDSRQELNFFFIAGRNAASECSFIGFIVIISSFLMEMLSFMMSGSES